MAVENEYDWSRDAIGAISWRVLGIAQIVAVNDLRLGVAQQCIFDVSLSDEVRINRRWLIGNPREVIAPLLDIGHAAVQIHQLCLTKGTPGGGPEKKQNHALVTHKGLQG